MKKTCLCFYLILIALIGLSGFGGPEKGERSPQSLHDEFMGYAQEYYDEAKKFENKARHAKGSERSQIEELAKLNRQMGDLKVNMAKGFLNHNESDVKKAEKEYYRLDEKKEALLKKIMHP